MLFEKLRRRTFIKRRKRKREPSLDDAARLKDILELRLGEKRLPIPPKLKREFRQQERGQHLYKLDLRRAHLTDGHVEALTETLGELPVIRKLDLRGNDLTARAIHTLNALLERQLERFRSEQFNGGNAHRTLDDGRLCFLYSVKLDADVLVLEPDAAAEMEEQATALEVADSVLDVRHAFLQADIRGTGTLTEYELCDAMHSVTGTMPKPSETERMLRLYGETTQGGSGRALISMEGFEAAMVGRLRQAQTLPKLPRACDDLLFGPANDGTEQEAREHCSPWRTSSFRRKDTIDRSDHDQRDGELQRSKRPPDSVEILGNEFDRGLGNGAHNPLRRDIDSGVDITSSNSCSGGGETAGRPSKEDSQSAGGSKSNASCRSDVDTRSTHEIKMIERQRQADVGLAQEIQVTSIPSAISSSSPGESTSGSCVTEKTVRSERRASGSMQSVGTRISTELAEGGNDAREPRGTDPSKLQRETSGERVTWISDDRRSSSNGRWSNAVGRSNDHGSATFDRNGFASVTVDPMVDEEGYIFNRQVFPLTPGPARELSGSVQSGDHKQQDHGSSVHREVDIEDSTNTDSRTPTYGDSDLDHEEELASKASLIKKGKDEDGEVPVRLRPEAEFIGNQVLQSSPSNNSPTLDSDESHSKHACEGQHGIYLSSTTHLLPPMEHKDTCTEEGDIMQDGSMDSTHQNPCSHAPRRVDLTVDDQPYPIPGEQMERNAAWTSQLKKTSPPEEDDGDNDRMTVPAGSGEQEPLLLKSATVGNAVEALVKRGDERTAVTARRSSALRPASSLVETRGMYVEKRALSDASPIIGPTSDIDPGNRVHDEIITKANPPASAKMHEASIDSTVRSRSIGVQNETLDSCQATECLEHFAAPEGKKGSDRISKEVLGAFKGEPMSSERETGVAIVNAGSADDNILSGKVQFNGSRAEGPRTPLMTTWEALPIAQKDSHEPKAGHMQCGSIPEPWCLAPANIAARAHRFLPAACEGRELLAARIQLTSGQQTCTCTRSKMGHCGPSRWEELSSSDYLVEGARIQCTTPRMLASPSPGGHVDECSPSLSTGDSTPRGHGLVAGESEAASCLFCSHACRSTMDAKRISSIEYDSKKRVPPGGFLRPEEEQSLTVHLEEGALFLSRNGLENMGFALELEATYGYGRDTLLGLHTLILSCNQLKVLNMSVLTAMPALRHLDVSNNLLCRMEAMDGRDLPCRLETLNMSHNRISRIGGIGPCFSLRVLNLSHNRIKSSSGLEHLSLLEQLDLGHNLISKPVSARALSFNRSLKLLWLEGNPLAKGSRYRAALTCLLPHVRAIDLRGMPPSIDWKRRVLGENRSDGGSMMRAGSGVSRERQVGQDKRRSNEWQQVMAWREQQAQRATDTEKRKAGGRHEYQAGNAAQQRQLVDELAKPRRRPLAGEDTITRAKDVTSGASVVAFGITYRPENGPKPGGMTSLAGANSHTAQALRSLDTRQQQQRQEQAELEVAEGKIEWRHGCSARGDDNEHENAGGNHGGSHDGEGETLSSMSRLVHPAETSGSGAMRGAYTPERSITTPGDRNGCLHPVPSTATPRLYRAHRHEQVEATGPTVEPPDHDLKGPMMKSTKATIVESDISIPKATPVLQTTDETARLNLAMSSPSEEALAAREKWFGDVLQETETASTALQVMLKMQKDWGRDRDEPKHLARFRTVVDGMGLFAESDDHPLQGFHEENEHAERAKAVVMRLKRTKAAIKNMFRLIEKAQPAESSELDEFVQFLRQQTDIVHGENDDQGASDQELEGSLRGMPDRVLDKAHNAASIDSSSNAVPHSVNNTEAVQHEPDGARASSDTRSEILLHSKNTGVGDNGNVAAQQTEQSLTEGSTRGQSSPAAKKGGSIDRHNLSRCDSAAECLDVDWTTTRMRMRLVPEGETRKDDNVRKRTDIRLKRPSMSTANDIAAQCCNGQNISLRVKLPGEDNEDSYREAWKGIRNDLSLDTGGAAAQLLRACSRSGLDGTEHAVENHVDNPKPLNNRGREGTSGAPRADARAKGCPLPLTDGDGENIHERTARGKVDHTPEDQGHSKMKFVSSSASDVRSERPARVESSLPVPSGDKRPVLEDEISPKPLSAASNLRGTTVDSSSHSPGLENSCPSADPMYSLEKFPTVEGTVKSHSTPDFTHSGDGSMKWEVDKIPYHSVMAPQESKHSHKNAARDDVVYMGSTSSPQMTVMPDGASGKNSTTKSKESASRIATLGATNNTRLATGFLLGSLSPSGLAHPAKHLPYDTLISDACQPSNKYHSDSNQGWITEPPTLDGASSLPRRNNESRSEDEMKEKDGVREDIRIKHGRSADNTLLREPSTLSMASIYHSCCENDVYMVEVQSHEGDDATNNLTRSLQACRGSNLSHGHTRMTTDTATASDADTDTRAVSSSSGEDCPPVESNNKATFNETESKNPSRPKGKVETGTAHDGNPFDEPILVLSASTSKECQTADGTIIRDTRISPTTETKSRRIEDGGKVESLPAGEATQSAMSYPGHLECCAGMGEGETMDDTRLPTMEWIQGYDSRHECYYYHHVTTGESTWHEPNAPYEPYEESDEGTGTDSRTAEQPLTGYGARTTTSSQSSGGSSPGGVGKTGAMSDYRDLRILEKDNHSVKDRGNIATGGRERRSSSAHDSTRRSNRAKDMPGSSSSWSSMTDASEDASSEKRSTHQNAKGRPKQRPRRSNDWGTSSSTHRAQVEAMNNLPKKNTALNENCSDFVIEDGRRDNRRDYRYRGHDRNPKSRESENAHERRCAGRSSERYRCDEGESSPRNQRRDHGHLRRQSSPHLRDRYHSSSGDGKSRSSKNRGHGKDKN